MQRVTAKGILRHMFHGTYSACIALQFADAASARDSLGQLGMGWNVGEKYGHQNAGILIWTGNSAELAVCKQVLISLGADGEKIDSIKYSIDYGEAFEITCQVVPQEQASFGF
jgi:hypothetical protein